MADAQQRADLAALAEQEELLLFYDEGHCHRLSERVRPPHGNVTTQILGQA